MEPLTAPLSTAWLFPFVPQDWEHTPTTVQAYVHTLQDELTQLRERVEALEARLTQNSTTSHRPPSSDSPYKKARQRPHAAAPRKAGGKLHIPTDFVVAQDASDVESSSRLDFLLLHNLRRRFIA